MEEGEKREERVRARERAWKKGRDECGVGECVGARKRRKGTSVGGGRVWERWRAAERKSEGKKARAGGGIDIAERGGVW